MSEIDIEPKGWKLIGPDGQCFVGKKPMECLRKELDSRIPEEQIYRNLTKALLTDACWLCEDDEAAYIVAEDTPAELHLCTTCHGTIMKSQREIRCQKQ